MAKVEQNEDGTWVVGGIKFTSKEAADLFAASRTEPAPKTLIDSVPQVKKKTTTLDVFSYSVAAVVMLWLLSTCSGPNKTNTATSSSATRSGVSQSAALTTCQYALKTMSKDPESAEVPYVDDFGSGNEFYFAWGVSTKPVRMKNSFGAMLSSGASCIVDKTTGRITSISLNGS